MGRPGVVSTGSSCLISVLPARGEVWWCELAEIGRRPVVVLSRDAVIARHRRALIAPCTTTIRGLASEVVLEPGDDPVPGVRRQPGLGRERLDRSTRPPAWTIGLHPDAGDLGSPLRSRSTPRADAAVAEGILDWEVIRLVQEPESPPRSWRGSTPRSATPAGSPMSARHSTASDAISSPCSSTPDSYMDHRSATYVSTSSPGTSRVELLNRA